MKLLRMPDLNQFASDAGVTVVELQKISEAQVMNRESQLYKMIVNRVAQKWADMQKAAVASKGKRKPRVYNPYALTSSRKYQLTGAFPQFEVNYAAAKRTSAAFARSVSLMVSEKLLTLVGKQGKTVLLVGYQLRPALLRSRTWARLFVCSADPMFQAMFKAEDRELDSIYASMVNRGKRVPDALSQYMTTENNIVAMDVFNDPEVANVSCMMLDHLDTNFRQLATWMHEKSNKLLYFAIPANKSMEYGTNGHFEELDGYVVSRGDKVTLMFKGDVDFQRDYTHSNYLELIARTKVVMYGKTFVKEFVGRDLGYAMYKITAFSGEYTDTAPAYRSWNDPGYKDKYVLFTPSLKPGGSVTRKSDWRVTTNVVDARLVEDVTDMALLNVDGRMDEVIGRRLYSKAHNYVAGAQMVRRECALTTEELEAAMISIYAETFMRKYQASVAVSVFAPEARTMARLTRGGLSVALMSAMRSVGGVVYNSTLGPMRTAMNLYLDLLQSDNAVPLPEFRRAIGYTEYTDVPDVNSRFLGWTTGYPAEGFSSYLPGPRDADAFKRFSGLIDDVVVTHEPVRTVVRTGDTTPLKHGILGRVSSYVAEKLDDVGDVMSFEYDEPALTEEELRSFDKGHEEDGVCEERIRMVDMERIPDGEVWSARSNMRFTPIEQEMDPAAWDELSNAIVSRVMRDYGEVRVPSVPYVYNAYLAPNVVLPYEPGCKSDDARNDAMVAISELFPKSLLMDPSYIEAERFYNPFAVVMRTIRAKVDFSRLEALKPDSFYLPAIRTHVLPKVKETVYTTLATLAKRNADTPYVVDPMGMEELWERTKKEEYEAFYVPGTERYLKMLPKIVLDEISVREWLSKQTPEKRKKLESQDDFNLSEIASGVERMNLMLKNKLKPQMDSSYESSLQMPQSIQYDNSGRSVLVLSPIIRQKVKREQLILKPNVMIMQRKSREDMVRFINQFDWRKNELGERRYIEIDETMFDKSQLTEMHELYVRKLAEYGVSGEFVNFIREHMNRRTISAPKSGVAMDTEGQNPSGAPFTLDRNNEVSKAAIASLVVELGSKMEFVMIMGDDVLIAVRGSPPTTHWERDITRRFNLNPKVAIRLHGYFCSNEIVHLPGGFSTMVRDPVKAVLGFADMSLASLGDLNEKWISYVDSMRDVDNLYVQKYLASALFERWRITHPTVKLSTFSTLLRVHSSVKSDFSVLQSFISTVASKRYY